MSAWTECIGGGCPVPPETQVIVRFRYRHDGHHSESKSIRPASAYKWGWSATKEHEGGDIIAYRVVESIS